MTTPSFQMTTPFSSGAKFEFGVIFALSTLFQFKMDKQGGHTKKNWPKKKEEGGRRVLPLLCYNCNEAGHMKKDCPKKSTNVLVCYNCNEPGHSKKDCPKKREGGRTGDLICYNCNEPGHSKKDCPKKREGGRTGDLICYNCNEPGHIKMDCPKKKGGTKDVLCHFCSESGHIKKDCPKMKHREHTMTVCFNCNKAGHIKRNCPELLPTREEQATLSSPQLEPTSPKAPPGFSLTGNVYPVNPDYNIIHHEANSELTKKSANSPPPGLSLTGNVNPVKDLGYHHDPSPESKKAANSGLPLESTPPKTPPGLSLTGSANPKDTDERKKQELPFGNFEPKHNRKDADGRSQRQPLPLFIDTHCHLEYVFERYEHHGSFSDFAKDRNYPRNFGGCIASFCDPAAFSSFGMWPELLSEGDSQIWAAFGIHPHNAKYYNNEGLEDKLLKCLEHEKCVAFGEIGLDFAPHTPSDPKTQREVLTHQLNLGVSLCKPFIFHCRGAEEELLQILLANVPTEWKIHLHCYTGSHVIAQKYLDHYPNLFIGVTGNVTFDNFTNVHTVVRRVPLERLLIETDAPYNTPRNLPRAGRCKFSHPAHAYYVAKEIARLKGVELSKALSVLRENTRRMYGI